ncbi:MAG: Ig-like domain-containing protein [Anaerolineae bacterium]|jgi:uncharacterized repeat protein (TIGR01451 family)|nr:Ig-like domain-containing protein [Anaerolineae bacterium]
MNMNQTRQWDPMRWLVLVGTLALLLGSMVMLTRNSAAQTTLDCVPGPHSGVIDQDQTWCISNSPHLITSNVTVLPTVTLTIEGGVIVQGRSGTELQVQGHLSAIGVVTQPITFTSETDTGPEQWHGLYFNGGTGDLEHVVVRYAGGGNSDALRGNIVASDVLTGELRISDSVISDQYLYYYTDTGLNIYDSRVVVSNTLFTRNGGGSTSADDAPLRISGASSVVTLTANSFVGNMYDQVFINAGAMISNNMRLTWQMGLEGYRLVGGYVVPQGITLTVEPGVMIMTNGAEVQVQGHLSAIGTATQPITFTSVTNTGVNQWRGLYFKGGTGDLRHATVRYAGGGNSDALRGNIVASNVQDGELRISDSVISDQYLASYTDTGLNIYDSRVVVSNTLFTRNGGGSTSANDAPLRISGAASVVTLTANSFVGNVHNQVFINAGAMISNNVRLRPQTIMDGYFLPGDYVVPPGITLTVDPGVTVMTNNYELQVQGHLHAISTPERPITFTSQTNDAGGQWHGLYFNGGTGNLQHVVARYGGGANSGGLRGNIVAQNVPPGGLHIEQSALHSCSYYALMVRDSHVTLDGSTVTNNGSYSVYVDGGSVVTVTETLLQSNRDGMYIGGAAHVTGDRLSIENNRYGVYLGGDTAVFTLTNSAVVLNTGAGVYNSGNAQVTLGGAAGKGNTIMANNGYGANQVGTAAQMLATYNWWGDLSGPKHASNPGGVGEDVTNRVIFDPWAVEPQGPVPDGVYVAVGGPRTAPPGGSVAHTVLYFNGRTETVTNTVLELQLPARAAFVSASHGGIYWPQRHEVVWQLGDLAPGASGVVAVQARYAWGLDNGTLYAVQARLGGSGLPLGLSDPQTYLDLEVPVLAGMAALTPAQFDAERAAHPELDALYTTALAAGFVDGGAVRLDLESGDPITQAVLLHPMQGEVRYVRRQGDQVLAATFAAQAYTAQTPEGSMTVDWRTDAATFTGAWGEGPEPIPAGEAYAACRFAQLPGSVLDEKAALLAQTFASVTCYPCRSGSACEACGAALQRALPLPEAVESLSCLADAGTMAMTAAVSAMQDPKPDVKVTCYRGWTDWWYGRPWIARYQGIDAITGGLYGGVEDVICDPSQSCKAGLGYLSEVLSRTGDVGCVCKESTAAAQTWNAVTLIAGQPATSSACSGEEKEGVSRCQRTEIFRPHDPNAKYGPVGDLVPGQLITYTITYENEGAGTAYGVFVTDQLDDAFDLATLTIHGPGQLIAANRTLLWDIGELAPQGEPGSQGVVSFTVQLRSDVSAGTAVINQATVNFPTVNEETPTNPVVNFVRPLVAIPQRLETGALQPVVVALAGRAPNTQTLLTFSVVEPPLNGTLSGAAPNLVYTPAENFTGLERFTFSVSDGITESLPAEVLIEVTPSAADTTPPQVIWVSPAPGTEGILFSLTAVLTGTTGPTFAPFAHAQFSEALDAVTVSTQTVQLVEAGGNLIPISVAHDPTAHRTVIQPRVALQGGTWYTATINTGITDLMGNTLVGDYVWRFRTVQTTTEVYLPLVLKH